MALLNVRVIRNLRRSIMRGHPWLYADSIQNPFGKIPGESLSTKKPAGVQAQLCRLTDAKGDLGWAMYDPHSPLAVRILSTEKSAPQEALFQRRMVRAFELRAGIRQQDTNAYRLFNGEGDLLPGLVCDIYDKIAVVQFDGQGPGEFWDRGMIGDWLLKNMGCESVIEKTRRNADRTTILLSGKPVEHEVEIVENGARYLVNLEKGQKTGFFLDQRDNRLYVRHVSKGKSVLNLFSYTGGFSVNAGLGGAKRVASLDVSRGAIDLSVSNWQLNELTPSQHEGLCVDVFEYLNGEKEMWDHIIVDPPSMSHSEDQKELAMAKYVEVFTAAAGRVAKGGELSLSSCSSHVSFEDFFKVIDDALSGARRTGQIMRVSGQGPDHPFPHACHELRYLKFVHIALD